LMDIATSIVQLSGLLLLSHFGGLSAGTGFIMVGATCAVTGIGVLILIRRDFTPKPAKALVDLRQNWSFGKWAFAAQLAYLGIVYSVPWILALLHDPHTTGEFAACTSLVMIANPILLGLSNFLYPQAIRIFDSGGLVALRRLTFQATFTTIAIVSPLMILLIAFGGQLVATMYGPSYTGLQNIMTVLSANIVLFALNMGVENGLMTLRRPKSVFLSNSAGLVLTAAFGLALIYTYSVMGAAIVTLIGQVTTLVCKGYVFLSVTEEMAPERDDLVMDVS
jgi:O-antigen/teichoic acid export membrane protein